MQLVFGKITENHYTVANKHKFNLYDLFFYPDNPYITGWVCCPVIDGDEIPIQDMKEIINFTDNLNRVHERNHKEISSRK